MLRNNAENEQARRTEAKRWCARFGKRRNRPVAQNDRRTAFLRKSLPPSAIDVTDVQWAWSGAVPYGEDSPRSHLFRGIFNVLSVWVRTGKPIAPILKHLRKPGSRRAVLQLCIPRILAAAVQLITEGSGWFLRRYQRTVGRLIYYRCSRFGYCSESGCPLPCCQQLWHGSASVAPNE